MKEEMPPEGDKQAGQEFDARNEVKFEEEIVFRAESPLGEREAYALADYTSRAFVPATCAMLFLVCAVLSVSFFGLLDVVYGVALLVVGAVAAAILLFALPRMMRKNTAKSLIYNGARNEFTVMQERLEVVTKQGEEVVSAMRVPFESLAKAVEYKGVILVYLNGAQAYIIGKEGFSVGTADGFLDFCRSRGIKTVSK